MHKEQIQAIADKYQLNERQASFVFFYDGNNTSTAKKAGYKGDNKTLAVTGSRIANNAKVKQAIDDREVLPEYGHVLTPEDITSTWSQIARDTTVNIKDRIKCLENLARSHGMFIEKVAIKAQVEHIDRLTDTQLLEELDKNIGILSSMGLLPEFTE